MEAASAKQGLAVVTGASSGIGEAFARRLARDKRPLILVARRRERLEQLKAELAQAHGVTVDIEVRDLADPGDREALASRLAAEPVDLLVNNAGFGGAGRLGDAPPDRPVRMIEVNVVALVRLCHAVLPGMVARGGGGIVNVASVVAFLPTPYDAVYGASKAFVRNFSEALYSEYKPGGVKVLALCPGLTRSEFGDVAGIDSSDAPAFMMMEPETVVEEALTSLGAGRPVRVNGRYGLLTGFFGLMPRPLLRATAMKMSKMGPGRNVGPLPAPDAGPQGKEARHA